MEHLQSDNITIIQSHRPDGCPFMISYQHSHRCNSSSHNFRSILTEDNAPNLFEHLEVVLSAPFSFWYTICYDVLLIAVHEHEYFLNYKLNFLVAGCASLVAYSVVRRTKVTLTFLLGLECVQ